MKPDQLSEKEIIDRFNGGMAAAEAARADGLKKLQTLQTVKNRAQIKELRRLQARLGKEDPRVTRLAARIRYNEGLARDLAVEIDKTAIQPPAVDGKSWMVHGRVMDQKQQGLAALTVAIFDTDENWVRAFGYACTEARGYFAIVQQAEKGVEKKAQLQVQYFLRVLGPDKQLLHKDPDPLLLSAGKMEYREIFIDQDKALCSAPQAGPDDSALPSCKK
jgi:hypothetical protein